MSAISLKSITGITSITTPAGVDNQFTLHTNDTTQRLKVTESGVEITGVTTTSGDLFVNGNVVLPSSGKSLKIWTGGTQGLIMTHGGQFGELDNLTGMMRIKASQIKLSNRFGNLDMLTCNSFGSVDLFHNNILRFTTTGYGVSTTGLEVVGVSTFKDKVKIGTGGIPAGKLHIDDIGSTGGGGDIVAELDSGSPMFTYRNGTHSWFHAGKHPTDDAFVVTTGGTTTTSEKLRIASDGKIGINTSTANSRLHILASNESGILLEDSGVANNAPYLEIIAKRTDGNVHQSFSGQIFLSRNRTEQKISSGLKLGTILFGGNHTNASKSNILYAASIAGMSSGDFNSASDMKTDLVFFTGATGRSPTTANVSSGEERLRISSEGYVTTPTNVMFSANGGPSDLTDAVIIFGNSVFQRGGTNYSTSTGIFTAPVDGIYHFMCNPYRYTLSADSYIHLQTSTDNGSTWNNQIEIRGFTNGANGWLSLPLSNLIDLNSGNQVRIYATNRIHCNGVFSRFSGMLVG